MAKQQAQKEYIRRKAIEGGKCVWLRKKAKNMSRLELLAFISELDKWSTMVAIKLIDLESLLKAIGERIIRSPILDKK